MGFRTVGGKQCSVVRKVILEPIHSSAKHIDGEWHCPVEVGARCIARMIQKRLSNMFGVLVTRKVRQNNVFDDSSDLRPSEL